MDAGHIPFACQKHQRPAHCGNSCCIADCLTFHFSITFLVVAYIIDIIALLLTVFFSGKNTANVGFSMGTGTPEAGGVTFMQLLSAILEVCQTNVVGADINELAPMLDHSGVSTATACKVLRELLLALSK